MGPGDPELLSLKALKAMQDADIIYTVASRQGMLSVSGKIVASLPGITAECRELTFAMNKDWQDRLYTISGHAQAIAKELRKGKICAFASIGDSLTYSTCSYLVEALENIIPELNKSIIPGINSWSALAAAYGKMPLVEDIERLTVIPGYLEPDKGEIARVLQNSETIVFLKTYRTRNRIIELLREFPVEILYGANVGLENQFISDDINQIINRGEEYLSMLIVKTKKTKNR